MSVIQRMNLKYNVHHSTVLKWKHKYDKYGLEGLKDSATWKKYSKEFKLAAIRDCLSFGLVSLSVLLILRRMLFF
ncbi:helix-turn-helix domain-containing protein [Ornithinibacillus sp. 179-J 7C1 HS]|uniref:helix-turn-helix domain-containing protein n=1 Tax=Ornithinibacillus sp. 179-J 7C1 HS TaxID=3142384 RepID=UPI0039A331E2